MQQADSQTPIIQCSAVSKRVNSGDRELTILQGVDLVIQPGERCAVLGPSGAGKSTLLALLAALDLPSSGQVSIAGADTRALDEEGRARLRRERIGFVFQNFELLPMLTALENVALPLELRGERGARGRALELLGRVGLGERAGHRPSQLSGGEQQRVALARAFITEPPLLLADEPTGSLDAATREPVLDLLLALNREAGATLVLVTHDLDIAARLDRHIRLQAGRLVADDTGPAAHAAAR